MKTFIVFGGCVDSNIPYLYTAGKSTTDEELEEMLEGGNAAVFTAGVRLCSYVCISGLRLCSCACLL